MYAQDQFFPYPVIRGNGLAVVIVALGILPGIEVGIGLLFVDRLLEPLVLVGGMVGHKVHHDLHAKTVGVGQEVLEVVEVAEDGVDVPEVGDVVAKVLHGALVDGGEPDRLDSEAVEVTQLGLNA